MLPNPFEHFEFNLFFTETGMENGDRHYIWGQNGVKGYDPIVILIPRKLHCRGICLYLVIIFLFLKGF